MAATFPGGIKNFTTKKNEPDGDVVDANHKHDETYSPIEHTHTGYSPTNHNHDTDYLGIANTAMDSEKLKQVDWWSAWKY